MPRATLAAIVLAFFLVPLGAALPAPAYNCSPGFGGGLYCWAWVGNGCEAETYLPPNELYPGPGDATPHAFLYGCGPLSCYTDVDHGGELCLVRVSETCAILVRLGALMVETLGCVPA